MGRWLKLCKDIPWKAYRRHIEAKGVIGTLITWKTGMETGIELITMIAAIY